MMIKCGTDIGPVRKTNQDACDCGSFSKDSVWGIVCDGMGGVNGGNIASELAVQTIREHILKEFSSDMSAGSIKAMLKNAVELANTAVYETAIKDPSLMGMGTTAVAMLVHDGAIHIVHVGDSRAYIIKENKLEKLTTDHSYVQNLVDLGQITEDEARSHPKRNIITRAVGVHDSVRIDYITTKVSPHDVVVACSDGLTNFISDESLENYMKKLTGKKLVNTLINYAVEAGGTDNITVVAINCAD